MAMGPPDESTRRDASPDPARSSGWATRPSVPTVAPIPIDDPLPDAITDEGTCATAPRWSLSLTGWLLLGAAAVVMALSTFAVPAWSAARSSPRVVLLGCGSSLSVLIQTEDARVVIAAGDDPAAFGTSIGRALALSQSRIDLLIVAAAGRDLAVPADVAQDPDIRQVVRLGAPHPGRETGDLPAGLAQVPSDARIEIAAGVVARIQTVEIPDPDRNGDFDLAWRAEIRRGAATVIVLSDAEHARAFPPLTSRGVLVIARDPGTSDLGALLPSPAGALVVNADEVDGSEIRADLPPLLTTELPTVRVHSGTAVTLLLKDAGVELPPDDVVIVRPVSAQENPTGQPSS